MNQMNSFGLYRKKNKMNTISTIIIYSLNELLNDQLSFSGFIVPYSHSNTKPIKINRI